ncbi:unknown [Clostridium sp. CAG:575]|nr:unknown [Clostridium sp. CAG:575]
MKKLGRKKIIERISELILAIIYLFEVSLILFCIYYCKIEKITVINCVAIIIISIYFLIGMRLIIKCIVEILKEKIKR